MFFLLRISAYSHEYISEQITKFDIESEIVSDLEVMGDLDYLKSFDVILPVWTMGKIDDDNWELKNSKVGNLRKRVLKTSLGMQTKKMVAISAAHLESSRPRKTLKTQ